MRRGAGPATTAVGGPLLDLVQPCPPTRPGPGTRVGDALGVSQSIRVGIVGAHWGTTALLPALRAVPELEVVAICTAHEEDPRKLQRHDTRSRRRTGASTS